MNPESQSIPMIKELHASYATDLSRNTAWPSFTWSASFQGFFQTSVIQRFLHLMLSVLTLLNQSKVEVLAFILQTVVT